ncbi:hypothetical protein HDU81_001448 [Chytriomyces hyalinus]|nr:hypothetical protein HDU81_001448 [Chytriomyces hyalinus]
MFDPATSALVQLKSSLLPKKGTLTMMQLSDSFGGSCWLVIQAKDLSILRLGWGPDGEIFVEKESIHYDRNLPKQISCVAFHTLETTSTYLGPFIMYGTSNNEVGLLKLVDETLERIPVMGLKNQGFVWILVLKVQDQITNSCFSLDPVNSIEFNLLDDTLTIFAGCGSDKSNGSLSVYYIDLPSMTISISRNIVYSSHAGETVGLSILKHDIAFSVVCLCKSAKSLSMTSLRVLDTGIEVVKREDWNSSYPDASACFKSIRFQGINGDCLVIHNWEVHSFSSGCVAFLESEDTLAFRRILKSAFDAFATDSKTIRSKVETRRVGRELAFDDIAASAGFSGTMKQRASMYPPENALELFKIMEHAILTSDSGAADSACAFIYYLLKDMNESCSLEFSKQFGMTTGLRDAVDGLWYLDSGNFERAVMHLTSPGNNNLFRNESKVVRILLLNQEQLLASEYMEHCASFFKSTDLVDMRLKMQLENGGVNGAFMCQRGRLAEAVSWIESNRAHMNGNNVDAELIGKIENLKLVLPDSQLELIRHGNQASDEVSNVDRKDTAPASHLITALLDRCVESQGSDADMEDVDVFKSAVASPVIPATETPVGRSTGAATPYKKDHTRVASPFMKRALTPTRAAENTPTVGEMLSEHARQRSASGKKSTPLSTDGKPSNMFLEKPKSQNTTAMAVIKSPVGTPTTAHAMPLMNMSPFSSKKAVAFAVEPISVVEPTPAPFDDYEEPLKASTRQYRKTPARTRKSMAATSERKNLVDEEDSENSSAIAVAATPSYSLRATRARLAAPTPSLLSETPAHTTKTKPAAAKTPKPKKAAAASATPGLQKASSALSDDPMTLDELVGTSETPATTTKRGASRAGGTKSVVNKTVAAVAASAVETPRRSSRRIAKIVESEK